MTILNRWTPICLQLVMKLMKTPYRFSNMSLTQMLADYNIRSEHGEFKIDAESLDSTNLPCTEDGHFVLPVTENELNLLVVLNLFFVQ